MNGAVMAAGDTEARYARAAALADPKLATMVSNETVTPHWTGKGGEFWYARKAGDREEFVMVSGDGTRRPATDSERATVAAPAKQPTDSLAPNGERAAFMRAHNLWVREKSGAERQITTDGVDNFAWGESPDSGLMSIPRQRYGALPLPPYGVTWSDHARYIIATRTDERATAPVFYFEAVPQDGGFRPKVWPVRQAMAGDKPQTFETAIIDVQTGRRVALGDETLMVDEVLSWSADDAKFVALMRSDKGRTLMLAEVDAKTGAVRKIHSERPEGFVNVNSMLYSAPNMRAVRGGQEVLWYSERSGWGHLYRYRVSDGQLLNAVTQGDWLVRDVIHVDEAHGRVFFTAVGRDGANPYWRHLFRVNFDGTDLRDLTPESADHQFESRPLPLMVRLLNFPTPASPVSPDGSVFIDTSSTVTQAPVTTLRSTKDGHVIATLEKADPTGLLATGWRAPIPFVVKAADGKTDLYGVLSLPDGAEKAAPGSIPLVDAIYGGPQTTVAPQNFTQAHGPLNQSALTALGIAVFTIDARGTPLRSKAFQNAAFKPNFADAELDDHAAVVKQLAEKYKSLDPNRVGIYGHSFGGYVTVRAMLRHPDVFKVGVSSAGIHSLQTAYGFLSSYLPEIDGDNYRDMDNTLLASRLTGRLLLAYGDMDENAPPAGTAHLIDALVKANRRYDLLFMPNRTHSFAAEPYFKRRLWEYFAEHLAQDLR